MITLHLCVNDRNCNLTDQCDFIHVELDGDTVMQIECELPFEETVLEYEVKYPLFGEFEKRTCRAIDLDSTEIEILSKATCVGSMAYNVYEVRSADAVKLLNSLNRDELVLLEAVTCLFERWESYTPFTLEDFEEAASG